MKLLSLTTWVLASALAVEALSVPNVFDERSSLTERDVSSWNSLFKRKGGGGGGRGGGSSGGSSGGKSGSSSSGSSSSGRTSATSNVGGATKSGSGPSRGYGGGAYYGGGAAVPYAAGAQTTKGRAPLFLLPAAGLGFFGGYWAYGAYGYPYTHPYTFYNASARQNQTKPITCLCEQYHACGCADNDDKRFLNSVIGNGTNLDKTLVQAARVNDTEQIFLNGTLPNGTTAPGGSDSAAPGAKTMESVGWCVVGSLAAAAMWAL